MLGALAIVALAAVLRLEGLARDSLSYDEVFSRDYAWGPLSHPRHWNNGMALFHTVLHVWVRLVGDSDAVLRVPSALFGIAGAVLLIWFVQRISGWRTALAAGLMLALAWRHVFYSQEVRSYALFISLVILTTLLLVRLLERPSPRRLIAYGVALVALSYSHYQWVFVLVFHNLTVLLSRRRVGWGWAVLHAAVAVAYVPQIVLGVLPQRDWDPFYVVRYPTVSGALWALQDMFSRPLQHTVLGPLPGAWTINKLGTYLLPLAAFAGIVVCALPVARRLLSLARKPLEQPELAADARWTPRWLPLVWFGAVFVLPFLVGQLGTPVFRPRYMAGVLPVTCWFIGVAITALPRLWLRVPALVVCVLLAMPALETMKQKPMRENWRGCAAEIARNERPGDTIVLCDRSIEVPFDHYYHGPLPTVLIDRTLMTDEEIEQALGWAKPPARLWLVVSHDPNRPIIDYMTRRPDYALVRDYGDTFLSIRLLLFERIERDADRGAGSRVN